MNFGRRNVLDTIRKNDKIRGSCGARSLAYPVGKRLTKAGAGGNGPRMPRARVVDAPASTACSRPSVTGCGEPSAEINTTTAGGRLVRGLDIDFHPLFLYSLEPPRCILEPCTVMPEHDDHRDAHLASLRVALGLIMSPKRPQYSRTSTQTSGTASPALHCPNTAVPLAATTSSSSDHSTHPGTFPRACVPHSHLEPSPATIPMARAGAASPLHELDSPLPASSQVPAASSQAHADFLGTLQSKRAWDALIHGSWV
ncbi:hypothetical protein AcW1_002060 [Taiwanofungus camphoratus]|nr:hypothetical protein AcW1_002060 [Antrodia cinnamomea]